MFMKLGTWLTDRCWVQFHHTLPSQPPFWRKMECFCGWYGQTTCMNGCTFCRGHYKVNLSSLARFMKLGTWLIARFLAQSHYFQPSQTPLWSKMHSFVVSMAKSTCVYSFILYGCHYKVNLSSWERFIKLGTWLTDRFIAKSHHFQPSRPPRWSKST